jgi:hypothetical protein
VFYEAWQAGSLASVHGCPRQAQNRALLRRHGLPTLGGNSLGPVRPSDIERLLATASETLSPPSCRSLYATLRAMLADALRDGLFPKGTDLPHGAAATSTRSRPNSTYGPASAPLADPSRGALQVTVRTVRSTRCCNHRLNQPRSGGRNPAQTYVLALRRAVRRVARVVVEMASSTSATSPGSVGQHHRWSSRTDHAHAQVVIAKAAAKSFG